MSEFDTYMGFVQFDVNAREVSGQKIRDFVIKPKGSDKSLRITLWPEWAGATVAKDDFVVVEGKVKTNVSGGKTYYNLNPTRFVNLGHQAKGTDEVANPVAEEDEDIDPGF